MSARTNGNGVPYGWVRFSSKGSTYYCGKQPHLVLRRAGTEWQILHADSKAILSTGTTMVEATTNLTKGAPQ